MEPNPKQLSLTQYWKQSWTYLPCLAHKIVKMRLAYGASLDEPIIDGKGKLMTYSYVENAIDSIMTQLGVDLKSYGTHSLRAG